MQFCSLIEVPLEQQCSSLSNKVQGIESKTGVIYSNSDRPGAQLVPFAEFDGKRLRKAVARKTIDYNSSVVRYLENRMWQRDYRDRRAIQPDAGYYIEMTPPQDTPDNPMNAVTTKFVHSSTNKIRCPIFCLAWTPEGRRLITGASSGELTLWNGLTFNFETILQAHESAVRCMVWNHYDSWMVTGDHSGYIKYWQSNMNNVNMFQAHREPLRGISFSPFDTKFASCSDDCTVRIWDFRRCQEEKVFRDHGAQVTCIDWHPQMSLIVSGSKDSQQPIKLWDPKSGKNIVTSHAHKNAIMEVKWNSNGNWFLTASRDHLLKLFDVRNMREEVQTFRGHKKEVTTVSWHPIHESLFASGGFDGSLMFWIVGDEKAVDAVQKAHDSSIWSLAWHPLGHILCSGSNDHASKFWTRKRPGDGIRDKCDLDALSKRKADLDALSKRKADSCEDEPACKRRAVTIPGLDFDGEGTQVEKETPSSDPITDLLQLQLMESKPSSVERNNEHANTIPGLDLIADDIVSNKKTQVIKKVSRVNSIPQDFQRKWMEGKQPLLPETHSEDKNNVKEIPAVSTQNETSTQPVLHVPLQALPPPYLPSSINEISHFNFQGHPSIRMPNQLPFPIPGPSATPQMITPPYFIPGQYVPRQLAPSVPALMGKDPHQYVQKQPAPSMPALMGKDPHQYVQNQPAPSVPALMGKDPHQYVQKQPAPSMPALMGKDPNQYVQNQPAPSVPALMGKDPHQYVQKQPAPSMAVLMRKDPHQYVQKQPAPSMPALMGKDPHQYVQNQLAPSIPDPHEVNGTQPKPSNGFSSFSTLQSRRIQ